MCSSDLKGTNKFDYGQPAKPNPKLNDYDFSTDKNPINALRNLGKYEYSSNGLYGKSNEVTLQWNEHTGSLSLLDKIASDSGKSEEYKDIIKETNKGMDDNQMEIDICLFYCQLILNALRLS